jgi:hypothetical protein
MEYYIALFILADEVDIFIEKELETPSTFPPLEELSSTLPPPVVLDNQDAAVTAKSVYKDYLTNLNSQFSNEHEYFIKAKSDLQKHHHDKVTKVICFSRSIHFS